MLSKEASSTNFWVFGMTRPGIEPRSPGPLANITMTWIREGKTFCVTCYLETKSFKTLQAKFCNMFNNYPQKSHIYCWVHKFQATESLTPSNRRQKIPDLVGSWQQYFLTMWMRWEILLEEVQKSPSEDISKNSVYLIHHYK